MCYIQRSAKVDAPGLVNFIPAVAYHFCLNLPAAFTKPGASTLADLCIFEFNRYFYASADINHMFVNKQLNLHIINNPVF